jgi:hypothetical protein
LVVPFDWKHAVSNSTDVSELAPKAPSNGMRADAWLTVTAYWYLSVVLAALGFSLGFYFMRAPSAPHIGRRDPLRAVNLMDGRHYKQICVDGYLYDPELRSNVAFFPAFPLLGRCLIAVGGLRPEAALLIVSNVSLLAALGILSLYVRARRDDQRPEIVNYVVLIAAVFPTGCFFHLAYSESTFLLLALLAMYAMLRRWPLWSVALVVGAATAARPVGVALLAPLAIHIARRAQFAVAERLTESSSPRFSRPRVADFGPPLALLGRWSLYLPLACWGLVAFLAFQYSEFGDPFAVFKAHDQWRVRPDDSPIDKATALFTLEPIYEVYNSASPAYWAKLDDHGLPWFSLQFMNPIFFVAAIGLLVLGARRRWLSVEETSLAGLMLFIPYLTRAHEMCMGSMGRFVAVVFPVYLVVGELLARLPAPIRTAVVVLSGVFLVGYTALYAAGYLIF